MKRRKFAQSLFVGAGLSAVPISLSMASNKTLHDLQTEVKVKCSNGLLLTLNKTIYPTKNKDTKQFILTYDVSNNDKPLEEKIYDLKLSNGQSHAVFMTPVNGNKLQAVFNRRLNA